jgi:hypothetical protein
MRHRRAVRVMRALAVLGTVGLFAVGSGSAAAAHGSRRADVAATRQYLLAVRRRLLEEKGDGAISEADVKALPGQVSAGCPGVLADAPATVATEEFKAEILDEVIGVLVAPGRSAVVAFARTVEQLKWSDRKLTYFVHGAAEEQLANVELTLPDLCVEAMAFAASGFQSIPLSSVRFLRESEAANDKVAIVARPAENPPGGLQEKISVLLKPYELASEKAIIPKRPSRHARELGEELGLELVFGPAEEVESALGLPVTAPTEPGR